MNIIVELEDRSAICLPGLGDHQKTDTRRAVITLTFRNFNFNMNRNLHSVETSTAVGSLTP